MGKKHYIRLRLYVDNNPMFIELKSKSKLKPKINK